MKRKTINIIGVIILVLGLACVAYPFASNALYQREQSQVIEQFNSRITDSGEAVLTAERAKAYEYNRKLVEGRVRVVDPFDPNVQGVNDTDYAQALNMSGNGVMATISIPKLGLMVPVYHGTSDSVLAQGVGHLSSTSLPIGGESAHCVLAGHTGLPTVKVFDALDTVELGDYFIINVLGEQHAYRVYNIEVVLPEETDSLVVAPGRDLMTLVTCVPYGVNSHRLLVHGERCEMPETIEEHTDIEATFLSMNEMERRLLEAILGVDALVFMLFLIRLLVRKRRRREKERAENRMR